MSQAYVSSCHDVICLGGWLDKVSSHTMHSTATAILPSLPLPATFQKVEDRSLRTKSFIGHRARKTIWITV
jgi:hypothetical protein